jgi:signal transduction histidine kinase
MADKKLRWTDMTPADGLHLDHKAGLELKNTGVCKLFEKDFLRPDGKRVSALVGGALLEGSNHKAVATVLDDTDRKLSEQKIREANTELLRLNRIRSEFTTMVTHELRTPLTAIKEGIELIRDGIDGPVTSDQCDTLDIAKNNVDRLARLIHNVLDFSKIEAGIVEMHFEQTDLNKLTREVCSLMAMAALKKNIQVDFKLPPEALLSVCDPDKIMQILINIFDNAIKFTESGGRITLNLLQTPQEIRIEIKDSGIGIRPEDINRIFEMYGQGAVKGMWKTGGFGVGLAISKKLAEHHGGKIMVESEPEQGTKFILSLPAKATQVAA